MHTKLALTNLTEVDAKRKIRWATVVTVSKPPTPRKNLIPYQANPSDLQNNILMQNIVQSRTKRITNACACNTLSYPAPSFFFLFTTDHQRAPKHSCDYSKSFYIQLCLGPQLISILTILPLPNGCRTVLPLMMFSNSYNLSTISRSLA